MKGLLAVLSLGALVSMVYLFSLFRDTGHVTALADPSVLQAQALGLLEASRDTDSDGLLDAEETYWETDFRNNDTDGDGFLDGEEVLSGHDPAKPGPSDWLDRSQNLTDESTRLTIGGILAGDLQEGSAAYESSVELLLEDIAEKYRENTAITVDDVTLTTRDDAAAWEQYVGEMAWTINGTMIPALDDAQKFLDMLSDITWDDFTPLTDNPKRYAAFRTASRKLSQNAGERAAKVAAQPVPRSFAVQHKTAIRILRTLQRQYELAAQVKNDPIQGAVALRAILTLHTKSIPLFMADFGETVVEKLSHAN